MFKFSNAQMIKFPVSMIQSFNVPKFQYSNVPKFKWSNVPMVKCSNVQIFKFSNFQIFKCSNIKCQMSLKWFFVRAYLQSSSAYFFCSNIFHYKYVFRKLVHSKLMDNLCLWFWLHTFLTSLWMSSFKIGYTKLFTKMASV